eukprot:5816115-Amphidinium_carterae.1
MSTGGHGMRTQREKHADIDSGPQGLMQPLYKSKEESAELKKVMTYRAKEPHKIAKKSLEQLGSPEPKMPSEVLFALLFFWMCGFDFVRSFGLLMRELSVDASRRLVAI